MDCGTSCQALVKVATRWCETDTSFENLQRGSTSPVDVQALASGARKPTVLRHRIPEWLV